MAAGDYTGAQTDMHHLLSHIITNVIGNLETASLIVGYNSIRQKCGDARFFLIEDSSEGPECHMESPIKSALIVKVLLDKKNGC